MFGNNSIFLLVDFIIIQTRGGSNTFEVRKVESNFKNSSSKVKFTYLVKSQTKLVHRIWNEWTTRTGIFYEYGLSWH